MDIRVHIFNFTSDFIILRFNLLSSCYSAQHFSSQLPCLLTRFKGASTFSTSTRYLFSASRPLTSSQPQQSQQRRIGDSRRGAELSPNCFFCNQLGASSPSPSIGFALLILGDQDLLETVKGLKVKCDEFSSLVDDLKQLLQDSQMEVSLVRVEKLAIAEWIETLGKESRGLRAERKRLQKLFDEVSATS